MKTDFLSITPQKSTLSSGESQTTDTILMIEPTNFGFNEQTSVNNYFQQKINAFDVDIQQYALEEFNEMVKSLRAKDVNILVVKDTLQPHTPDSIFPNNWVSFHKGGQVVLYPLFAENRRKERRKDIFQLIEEKGTTINNVDDFTFWEEKNLFLEGTGSMVFDRVNKIAYAALSERTDKYIFLQFCKIFDFEPVYFSAYQLVNKKRLPIYHTNVMMCVADNYAVICTDCIDNTVERKKVMDSLKKNRKEIIAISETQMHSFAGNMLQVKNGKGEPLLVMSQSAYNTLTKKQIERLNSFNELTVVAIPTIEIIGGGSVRCMMAEIF